MPNITTLGEGSKFMFSVFKKTGDYAHSVAQLAWQLSLRGVELVASGGTKKWLEDQGRLVTDCASITGLNPVLDHRVATLCPELHGGFLAEEQHMEELSQLNWPTFAGICCSFYDLKEAMSSPDATYDSINSAVDIGGPAMIRSAIKGGRIVLIDKTDIDEIYWLLVKTPEGPVDIVPGRIRLLQLTAARKVQAYLNLEVKFRFEYLTE